MINQIVIIILKRVKRIAKILLAVLLVAAGIFISMRERGIYTFWHNKVERVSSSIGQRVMNTETPMIIDARTPEEFEVSHIENAVLYTEKMLDNIDENQALMIYCTVGVRSNSLANELSKKGFKHVYELKTGILGWKNESFPVVNQENELTEDVHVYNAFFSRFLKQGKAVY